MDSNVFRFLSFLLGIYARFLKIISFMYKIKGNDELLLCEMYEILQKMGILQKACSN